MLSTADFELLLQANRTLSSQLDSAMVLKTVMELATKVVKAEASSLLLLDEAAQELYFDVALGEAGESVKQIRLKVGEGIAGWVARERQPLIVNDVTRDQRFSGKVDKSTRFITRSILAVPLLAKGRLIGVVEAINKEKQKDFSEEDQEVFEVFASQAAIAIENARLFSAVSREKEKLNTVFAEMSEGVLLLDLEGHVILMNAAGGRFLGFKPEGIVGKKFGPALFPGFSGSDSLDKLESLKDKMTLVELERREGIDFFIRASILRMTSTRDSSSEGYLVILQDQTEEKKGERLKRNFLGLISHKLKTPLTVIVGYAPILTSKMDNLTEFQKKAVSAIAEQGAHLSGLVDKLLRFTIVESDSVARDSVLTEVGPMVQKAVEAVIDSDNKALEAAVEPDVQAAPKVFVDPELTFEVIKNLVENAVKFNDKETKRVRIGAKKEGAFLRLEVEDNGVGIPAEEMDKVFHKFYQIENSFTGQVPGAGLGLTLCKKVVEAMDGRIQIESKLGKGSRVTVFLPLEPSKT